jgi:hypothetical protein
MTDKVAALSCLADIPGDKVSLWVTMLKQIVHYFDSIVHCSMSFCLQLA